MKKSVLTIVVVAVILGGVIFFLNLPNNPGESLPPVIINMTDEGYDQTEINIKKGQTVQFMNNGKEGAWPASNIHPSHSIYPEFDPQEPVPPGTSWSFKFKKAGSWRFHDHLRPGIVGVVNVQP